MQDNKEVLTIEHLRELLQQTLSSIETKEKPITEKSIYDLPEGFEFWRLPQMPVRADEIQFSVPRSLSEGEESFWTYNNIAIVNGIRNESFICESEFGNENDGFNCSGEYVEKYVDGTEKIYKTWLLISDNKYDVFLNGKFFLDEETDYENNDETNYDEILDENYIDSNPMNEKSEFEKEINIVYAYEDWNYSQFAFNILFCEFVEQEVKGENTYYKIIPKYSGEPDLQKFVEKELKFYANEHCNNQLIKIPYFFKYHFDKSKNAIEFLRNAINTTNKVWGKSKLEIICKNRFNEWLEHTIQENGLNREEIFRQPTASATVEESKKEMPFDDLFPSIEDKEMVMQMLVALKIINSEGKYLLGTKTGIIRVFIDVMKEEGYFIDIERKPILRVFTPVILGRRIEVINEPSNFDVMKRRILIKLKELIK